MAIIYCFFYIFPWFFLIFSPKNTFLGNHYVLAFFFYSQKGKNVYPLSLPLPSLFLLPKREKRSEKKKFFFSSFSSSKRERKKGVKNERKSSIRPFFLSSTLLLLERKRGRKEREKGPCSGWTRSINFTIFFLLLSERSEDKDSCPWEDKGDLLKQVGSLPLAYEFFPTVTFRLILG